MNALTRPRELRSVSKTDSTSDALSASPRSIPSAAFSIREISAAFMEHRRRLEKHATKIVGCPHSAEDIVQDAYIKAIETVATAEIVRPIPYLYQIVRNLAIDHYRRVLLEGRYFANEEEGVHVADSTRMPEAIVIDRQRLRLLAEALAELPKRTQRAFELHSVGGYTQREVAKRLKVSPTLVNFMVRDALKHCRDVIDRNP